MKPDNKDKILLLFILFVFIDGSIILTALMMNFGGYASAEFHGFAVDGDGRIYVGKDEKIEVFQNGGLVNKLKDHAYKNYVFTMQDDGTLLITNSDKLYITDLEGNTLSEYEDTFSHTYNALNRAKYKFASADGKEYSVKNRYLRYKIVDGSGNVLYKMPVPDLIFKILFFTSDTLMFIFVPWFIVKFKKHPGII
ncbi:MAG: hypothetical protein IJL63_03385 [Clostridia bacterium]|nr:hypothetical protein [Clostridia bacterium]